MKILSGFGFDQTGPYFVIDEVIAHNTNRYRSYIIDHNFSIKPQADKFCIGRYDLRNFDSFPCPNRALLTGKKENVCYDCFKFNSFNPSFYNLPVNQISEKQRAYNSSPHHVYLAFFAGNMVKVGISHHERSLTRWLEQGARVAGILYKCDNAYQARAYEESISKNLRLSETIRNDQKRAQLKKRIHHEQAIAILKSLTEDINKFSDPPVTTPLYSSLDENYLHKNAVSTSVIDVTDERPLQVSGTGSGLIGDILIFENAGQQFMVSLKKFMGHQILFDEVIIRQSFAPTQTSLF